MTFQSKFGIGFDQTAHILQAVKHHFGPDVQLTKTNIPLCTDKELDKEIMLDNPEDPAELKHLERQYKGSFVSLYGDIQHISIID